MAILSLLQIELLRLARSTELMQFSASGKLSASIPKSITVLTARTVHTTLDE
jgi:hypothetical protein